MEINRDDTTSGDRLDLVLFRDTVVIQVLPQHEPRPNRVSFVDDTIAIRIELAKGFKAIPGKLTVLQRCEVAEQLSATGHPAVVVAVEPEECLVCSGSGPA